MQYQHVSVANQTFLKKTTRLERQINSQLQLRTSVYNLVAGHPEPGNYIEMRLHKLHRNKVTNEVT